MSKKPQNSFQRQRKILMNNPEFNTSIISKKLNTYINCDFWEWEDYDYLMFLEFVENFDGFYYEISDNILNPEKP